MHVDAWADAYSFGEAESNDAGITAAANGDCDSVVGWRCGYVSRSVPHQSMKMCRPPKDRSAPVSGSTKIERRIDKCGMNPRESRGVTPHWS